MRGEGLGFLLRRHQHLLPAQQQRAAPRAGRSCQHPPCSAMRPQARNPICSVPGPAWGACCPRGDGTARPLFPHLCPLAALPQGQQLGCGRTWQPSAKSGVQRQRPIRPGAGTQRGRSCPGTPSTPSPWSVSVSEQTAWRDRKSVV